jgi:hypothetical protein
VRNEHDVLIPRHQVAFTGGTAHDHCLNTILNLQL